MGAEKSDELSQSEVEPIVVAFDEGLQALASTFDIDRYLAIYEVDSDDVELAKKALDQAAGSYHMSGAFDVKTAKVAWASAVSDLVER